jgi:GTP-binding protein
MFIDKAEIVITAGSGGKGSSAMRREMYVPLGGPWGGDGGKGGDVVMIADRNLGTLIDYTHNRNFIAESGDGGGVKNRNGRQGEPITLKVPCGTLVLDVVSGERLADLTEHGQSFVAAKGGRGGRGNTHFKTSTRQAPTLAEMGEPGEQKRVRLELKLLADVGVVGYPNAGKSTLLAAVSAARPAIAPYPFTTLEPKLGVVYLGPEHHFIMADMPGLIDGASEGKGLGLKFLKHLERTRVLLFLLEGGRDVADLPKQLKALEHELSAYHKGMLKLPRVVAVSKSDLPEAAPQFKKLAVAMKRRKIPCFLISGAAHQGLQPLLSELYKQVQSAPATVLEADTDAAPIHKVYKPGARFTLERVEGGFVLSGKEVAKWVALTDFGNDEATRKLKYIFEKIGVGKALREAGAETGDSIFVGKEEFSYAP